jgi:hypothetical protein
MEYRESKNLLMDLCFTKCKWSNSPYRKDAAFMEGNKGTQQVANSNC